MTMETKVFRHKRVAIDFDGTLFDDPGNIETSFQEQLRLSPKPMSAEVTGWLKSQGFEILIFTCRPDYHRSYLEGEMKRAGISHDYILFYTKPRVDLYIDDKGFRFKSWPETKAWILERLHSESNLAVLSQEPSTDFEEILRKEKIGHLPLANIRTILDVGCGSGTVWNHIDRTGKVIDAVEPDAELRARALSTGFFRKVFSKREEAQVEQYDCVSLLGVLEHIDKDSDFIDQFSIAKSVYLTVPNANSFHRAIGMRMGVLNDLTELKSQDFEVGHQRYYTYDAFFRFVTDFSNRSGHKIRSFGSSGFKFLGNSEMALYRDRINSIFMAARDCGFTGVGSKFGAELFAFLER